MIRSRLIRGFQLLVVAVAASGGIAQQSFQQVRTGIPEDWTHHHLIFTADYLRAHPEIFAKEPRALHQVYRRWIRPAAITPASLNEADSSTNSGRDWNCQRVGGTTAFGTSPIKFQADPSAPPSCTADFVVFAINVNGSLGSGANGQATITAVNNLYAGPSGTGGQCTNGPVFLYNYDTSTITNGKIRTSPVMSLDGKKIAFVESTATGSALHILKFGTTGDNGGFTPNNRSIINPVVPGTGNNATMVTINYTTKNNTRSSPWVDYSGDVLYVGDDGGTVYAVTGVFKGTPTLLSTGGWPVVITGGGILTGPVLDPSTGNLFIGDSRGFLHSFNAATPGTIKNLAVGNATKLGANMLDAPIVDTNGSVYAISSNNGTSAVVVQADTTTLTAKATVNIGRGSTAGTSINLYDGDFDNAFYTSQNTGHFLVCGTGAASNAPSRYRLPVVGGLITADNTPVQISTSTSARCGPITNFFNPNIGAGTDYFFWGVTNNCVGTAGCIMELANATTVATAAETNGTSGVIIDNESTTVSQASNIYFASQGGTQATRLAIKLTQSGLN